jgi:hypothetical protein
MARSSLTYIPDFSVKFFLWRAGLSDTNLKGTHPGSIPARFGLIWFSGFREEDLNMIFYQNMPNYGQNCSILSQNVPKLELYKHNDELLNIYYGIFFMNFELLPILTDYAN